MLPQPASTVFLTALHESHREHELQKEQTEHLPVLRGWDLIQRSLFLK